VQFADIFSFLYSVRPGTAAASLLDETPPALRQERFERLCALQEGISRRVWGEDVGRVLPVLVEGSSRQGGEQVFGRTTWNRIVNFRGSRELIGSVLPVRVLRSNRNSQTGEGV
jgi:tRNA-2-methylthio-N6-dimethylallyladenosine synthase